MNKAATRIENKKRRHPLGIMGVASFGKDSHQKTSCIFSCVFLKHKNNSYKITENTNSTLLQTVFTYTAI